jgi:hypothetical protein
MHRKIAVAELVIDAEDAKILEIGDIYAPEHIPVGIKYKDGVLDKKETNEWLRGRSIPASRQEIREAVWSMGLHSPNDLIMKCFGLSLSDQYWVNPVETPLEWVKINFFHNAFSEDVGNALFGAFENRMFQEIDGSIDLTSPDNTSDGWLKKKWKIIDGKRCLIKGGSMPFLQEPLNEAVATAIMKRISIPHVPYSVIIDDKIPYSVCDCFITSETELVGAYYITKTLKSDNHDSSYQHFLKCCAELGIPNAQENLDKMLVLDYLIFNEDRHYNNFGAVRNAKTLEWLGLAPTFDNGTSLWYKQLTPYITNLKSKSKPFRITHDEQIKLVKDFSWVDLSALDGIENEFHELLSLSPYIDEARIEKICNAFNGRVELLKNHIRDVEPMKVAVPPEKFREEL